MQEKSAGISTDVPLKILAFVSLQDYNMKKMQNREAGG